MGGPYAKKNVCDGVVKKTAVNCVGMGGDLRD